MTLGINTEPDMRDKMTDQISDPRLAARHPASCEGSMRFLGGRTATSIPILRGNARPSLRSSRSSSASISGASPRSPWVDGSWAGAL